MLNFQVCRNWYEAFHSPGLWHYLHIKKKTFTYRKHTVYRYETDISHHRTARCLAHMAPHLKHIVIDPNENYWVAFGFIHILSEYFEWYTDMGKSVMPLLEGFEFTFACESDGIVIGTGGKILEELRNLLSHFKDLKLLTLNNLFLEPIDTLNLLEHFQKNCRTSLQYLELVNVAKERCSIFHVLMFPNLTTLVMNQLQLNGDIVLTLARNTHLLDLVITQDQYSLQAETIHPRTWRQITKINPDLHVTLEVRGNCKNDIVIQPSAPVHNIIYKSPNVILSPATVFHITEAYSKTLECFMQFGLPRKHGSRSFNERADSLLVLLVRQCPKLSRLVIRQRLSTSTLLILVSEGKNLEQFAVRRNAVLKKSDWPKAPEWSLEFYEWLQHMSKDYQLVEQEVAKSLGQKWKMYSDQEFKLLSF